MRNTWRLLILALLLAGVSFAAGPPKPAGKRPLPAVSLTNSNSAVMDVSKLGNTGNWLLLYVHAKNPACEAFLRDLTVDRYGAFNSRIVIVVGGLKASELADWVQKFPDLSSVQWLADPDLGGMRALELHGAPVEMGIRDNELMWSLSGAPRSKEMLDGALLTWLKTTD